MKSFLFILSAIVFSNASFTQDISRDASSKNAVRIYGKVVDATTKKGLDAVSVQIKNANADGIDNTIAGMFTRKNGDFSFDKIAPGDSLFLIITAVGYGQIRRELAEQKWQPETDLGNFSMEVESRILADVTVTATRPTMELGIDRRVFTVEKTITATGGTAIDVLKNIPSVTVDVEGNVQLRKASPMIFVDGRPTILTLDQIPADNIEKVELITNPSAKFDASSNAGIINVVLKKNKRVGLNGTTSLSIGTPKISAANLNLNLRQGKVNFFVSSNYNHSGGRSLGNSLRQNKEKGIIQNYFNQYTWTDRIREFKSIRFGLDYYLDNRNTLTISQNLVKGNFDSDEEQSQEYFDMQKTLQRTGKRASISTNAFDRSSTQIYFTHKFAKTDQQLSVDMNYNKGSGNNLTNINNSYTNLNGTEYASTERVRNVGINNNDQLTIQVDYATPVTENAKFETGARSFIQSNSSLFNAFSVSQTGAEVKLPLSNFYKYKETVYAAYATFSNKLNDFSYQAGLRSEISKFEGTLVDKAQQFGYSYPSSLKNIWDGLFPSLFLTQALSDGVDLQLNYSRRIRRPNFRQLNPFIDFNDPVNLRQGNPTLKPEFTNAFELNYNNEYKGGNFLVSLYYRNTLGDVTAYSDTISAAQYIQLNNAAVDSNAILNTYINAKSQNRIGLDITLQQTLAKNLEIVPNINLQYRKINATVLNNNLSNQGFNWEAQLTANYKLEAPKSWLFRNINFQLTGEYESPEIIPQGRQKEKYNVDFAFRKELLKNKAGSITFAVNDVFNSERSGTIYNTENYYQDSYRRWNVRNFRLTFSYKFGNSNFSLFKRDNNVENNNVLSDSAPQ